LGEGRRSARRGISPRRVFVEIGDPPGPDEQAKCVRYSGDIANINDRTQPMQTNKVPNQTLMSCDHGACEHGGANHDAAAAVGTLV
jgi:hypothetical protein